MITKDSIEQTFCFFHQKWRVYEHSPSATQQDEIEYAIAGYVETMNKILYNHLAAGREDFLLSHSHFAEHMSAALASLEEMMA